MKLSTPIIIVCAVILSVGIASCGSSSTTSECSCEICINDVPAYPSDSAGSCEAFAVDQDCSDATFSTDSSQTCGDEDQPVCTVSGCSGQCQCPGEPAADVAADHDNEYETD